MTGSRRFNRVGVALSIAALGAVFAATLTPVSGPAVTASFWCLTCGDFAAVDVVANIIMFLPLGFAFAFATDRRWRSILACVAVTVFVELMQIRIVAGRDASLSDILSNSLGGLIGVEVALHRRALLRPAPRTAERFAVLWSVVFVAVTAITSLGLRPPDVPRSLWVQWTPERAGYDGFTGELLKFELDRINLPRRFYPPSSLGVDRVLRTTNWQATATLGVTKLQPTRSVIARIAEEFTVLVSVEQSGWDLVCAPKTRAGDFRFHSPKVTLRNAFDRAAAQHGGQVQATCARDGGTLVAGVDGREEVLRLSPSLGWRAILPDLPFMPSNTVMSGLWLLALGFPAGYWIGTIGRRADAEARRRRLTSIITVGTAFGIGLVAVPLLAGTSVAAWWEWASTLIGVVVGGAVGRVVATRDVPWLFPVASPAPPLPTHPEPARGRMAKTP